MGEETNEMGFEAKKLYALNFTKATWIANSLVGYKAIAWRAPPLEERPKTLGSSRSVHRHQRSMETGYLFLKNNLVVLLESLGEGRSKKKTFSESNIQRGLGLV